MSTYLLQLEIEVDSDDDADAVAYAIDHHLSGDAGCLSRADEFEHADVVTVRRATLARQVPVAPLPKEA